MIPGPIDLDAIFKLNEHRKVTRTGELISIEDFYDDPDYIYDWVMGHPKPYWKKYDRETRNGIDYNDCRLVYRHSGQNDIYLSNLDFLLNLLKKHYWSGEYYVDVLYEFNVFQTIKIFDNQLQHFPHVDSNLSLPDSESVINVLVYLDKTEDGGTAIYEGPFVENQESINLMFPVHQHFEIKKIIPSQFNKCVIFPGNRMHGAFIEDYANYAGDQWRITQIMFFYPLDEQGNIFSEAK